MVYLAAQSDPPKKLSSVRRFPLLMRVFVFTAQPQTWGLVFSSATHTSQDEALLTLTIDYMIGQRVPIGQKQGCTKRHNKIFAPPLRVYRRRPGGHANYHA